MIFIRVLFLAMCESKQKFHQRKTRSASEMKFILFYVLWGVSINYDFERFRKSRDYLLLNVAEQVQGCL